MKTKNLDMIKKRGKKMLFIFACLGLSVATHATLTIYPQLSSLQGCQFSYTLQAKQDGSTTYSAVPLYNALVTNQSGSQVNTTVANFDCSGKINIKITFSGFRRIRKSCWSSFGCI